MRYTLIAPRAAPALSRHRTCRLTGRRMMRMRKCHITRARHARLRPDIIAMRAIDPHRSGGNGDFPPRLLAAREARCLPNRSRGFIAAPSLPRAPKFGREPDDARRSVLKTPQFAIRTRQRLRQRSDRFARHRAVLRTRQSRSEEGTSPRRQPKGHRTPGTSRSESARRDAASSTNLRSVSLSLAVAGAWSAVAFWLPVRTRPFLAATLSGA